MKITITLTPEESADIQALAIEFDSTPAEILQTFASDVTGSLRSGGSDEREYARHWLQRHHGPRFDPLTEPERERMERLQTMAYRARQAQQAAWQQPPPPTKEAA